MLEQTNAELQPDLNRQPFTEAITGFFSDMGKWPWATEMPHALFIRDYYHLPESSPYDIDLLIDADLQEIFLAKIRERAKIFDLYCVVRRGEGVCFVLLFDLDVKREGRAWAFLEVRDVLRITLDTSVIAGDIDIDRANGLPLPTAPWIAFLEVFQGLRTDRMDKAKRNLGFLNIAPDMGSDIFASIFGKQVKLPASLSEECGDLENLKRQILLKKDKPAKTAKLPLKTRTNLAVFQRAYFVHYAKPWLFTIHGPDGVGKSTTCSEVERIFARLPLPFCSHHHITGWKYADPNNKKIKATVEGQRAQQLDIDGKVRTLQNGDVQTGRVHAILRWCYRKVPAGLQKAYSLSQGYNHYLTQLNRLVFKEFRRGNIIFLDRYIYDLVTKNIIKNIGWKTLSGLFVRMARLPLRSYVLTDRPKNIHARKQELTLDEIVRYEAVMSSVMKRRGVSTKTIQVEGNPPQTIGRIIATDILSICDPHLFDIFRAGRQ